MDKIKLPQVTLLGIDCVDIKRLQLAADISTKYIEFGAVKLLSSIPSNDPRVIPIRKIKSTEDYSEFLIKELDAYINTEFVIVFQYDGFILNPSAWQNEFLNYDYIGSPWAHLGDLEVGNGGFSLRSKKLTRWLANNWKKVGVRIHPEDIFISKFVRPLVELEGMKYAPTELALKFSMEGTERTFVWNGEFGFHGIKYTDISKWLDYHPEYKKDLTYKLDDYVTLMLKYPNHKGTVHKFSFGPYELQDYKKLSEGTKNYIAKATREKYYDWNRIKEGHIVVCRRAWRLGPEKVPIPAFEKRVNKIETFSSFIELRKKYPDLKIQYPADRLKKWQRRFIPLLGDWAYPKNISYSIFWF